MALTRGWPSRTFELLRSGGAAMAQSTASLKVSSATASASGTSSSRRLFRTAPSDAAAPGTMASAAASTPGRSTACSTPGAITGLSGGITACACTSTQSINDDAVDAGTVSHAGSTKRPTQGDNIWQSYPYWHGAEVCQACKCRCSYLWLPHGQQADQRTAQHHEIRVVLVFWVS